MANGTQLAAVYAGMAIAMLLMIVSGTSKRMLSWKRPARRRCAACRLDVRDCRCRQ
jgi:hypothetical protein